MLVACGPADVAGQKYSLGLAYDNNTAEIAEPSFNADGKTGVVTYVNSHRALELFDCSQAGSKLQVDLKLTPPAVESWQLEVKDGAYEMSGVGVAVRPDGSVVHAKLNGNVSR